MSKAFGRHLRDLRKNHSKFSQQEMADMLNISRSTYTYYETGKSEPGQEKLKKICEILDVDYNTLLGFSEESLMANVASDDEQDKIIGTLTPSEEQIILALRSMNSEEKEFISTQINKMFKE